MWAALRQADAEQKIQPLMRIAGPRAEFRPRNERVAVDAAESLDDFVADEDEFGEPAMPKRSGPVPEWKTLLESAGRQMSSSAANYASPASAWPADRRLVYIIDIPASRHSAGIVVELAMEREKDDGSWELPTQLRARRDAWQAVPDSLDRQIAQMLIGAGSANPHEPPSSPAPSSFLLRGAALETTLWLMCETGRCRVRTAVGERPVDPIRWDSGSPWQLRLRVAPSEPGVLSVSAVLVRDDEQMTLDEPDLMHSGRLLIAHGAIAPFDDAGAGALVALFRSKKVITVGEEELPSFLAAMYALPRVPAIDLPPDSRVFASDAAPTPCVTIAQYPGAWQATLRSLVTGFRYGSVRITGTEPSPTVFDQETLTVHHRDFEFEAASRARLRSHGAKEEWDSAQGTKTLVLPANRLGPMVLDLVGAGWHVDTDGAIYRAAGLTHATVRSGIDWFELDAGVRFGDFDVSLNDLLEARRAGALSIVLSDGSHGVLPLDWLALLGPIASGGERVDGITRYKQSQVALLDSLLDTVPDADIDETFARARDELRTFDRIGPADPSSTFVGTLREYQREGLGWLHFLRRFQLGGCLADDMGLGKTVQVLALLDSRREMRAPGEPVRPSLVVVPRSLVFNWIREAQRFTPNLRVLDYSGASRRGRPLDGGDIDIVITTYGTLRRDAAELAAIRFDYAILDEAQAIKNAGSASAKSARLIVADHRIAMTGTPIENRIEELWSLFEFLNPGMLGAASAFSALAHDTSLDGREVLARSLRPVVLRRTKEQVAADLPARTEQTLSVELEPAQRRFYDGLLESYRRSVLERVDKFGVGRSKMHILEALLRLRQAACHPALVDPNLTDAVSAKVDALLPALEEIIAQGHKALVFSQFTSFLSLVRARLDAAGVVYEYLDGRIRDRQSRVDRFQNDPACPLFLISLKAGGHGLNLTAADYVYLLDPWWNPAVEAQAIDRAHRIGQTRRVIATRLVARNTIEEKILQLQASKRALADAILGQDQGVLARIGRAELELLLS
jgi:superfamily II DNA or RNA helicase